MKANRHVGRVGFLISRQQRGRVAALLLYTFGIEAIAPAAILRARSAALVAVAGAVSSRVEAQTLPVCDAEILGQVAPTANAAVTRLWPADHSFRNVGFSASVGQSCEGIASLGLQVWSDEPEEDQSGDGHHAPDARAARGQVLECVRKEKETPTAACT